MRGIRGVAALTDSNPASAPSSQASVLEWPNGSICQVPRGRPFAPKFFFRNWWPRVVWSTMAV